jgi:hypothetical protein
MRIENSLHALDLSPFRYTWFFIRKSQEPCQQDRDALTQPDVDRIDPLEDDIAIPRMGIGRII